MSLDILKRTALILLILVLGVAVLHFGKGFLVPLVFGALLSTLLYPVARWLMRKGVNKTIAILFSLLLLLSFFAGLFLLLGWQISDLSEDASQIEQQLSERYQQLRDYVAETFGVSKEKQDEMLKEQQNSSSGNVGGFVTGFLSGVGGFLTDTILTLVYIFLFLYFKEHIKRFFIRIAPHGEKDTAEEIVQRCARVTQKYLTGLAIMIVMLWVMYSIGFSIAGVKNPIFFAILCGLLEIIPFIGNITGTTVTVLVSIMQGGGTNVVIGILITYGLIQFVQTYIIEPLVVGSEVNINPLFTIISLVAGEFLWGISGMILAIPLMGVVKIVCDHVPGLQPIGTLVGETGPKKESSFKKKMAKFTDKISSLFGGGARKNS